ncbi:MAG: type IV toxin-antitoxin system AbiEi family antitoxin domain-containing protein [Acidimicrobiia bacterium]|nr:type IV toxin-antitoxin system AbiEi family antitoxin domain-containing protein [Acidimicrobiia bacterium]
MRPIIDLSDIGGQWRVATVRELDHAGVDARRRRALVDRGQLTAYGRGVYLLGTPLTGADGWWQRAAAAVRIAGPDAALSGRAAAAAWGLDGFEPDREPITVDVPPAAGCRRPWVRRVRMLEAADRVRGVPVTAASQTLLDLGGFVAPELVRRFGLDPLCPLDAVELALEAALRTGLVEMDELDGLTTRAGGARRGRASLMAILARRPQGAAPTESYLETRGIQRLRDAGLGDWDRQAWLDVELNGHRVRVDLHRDGHVIEFDGRDPHARHHTRDRRRWNALTAAGYQVRVFTWADVEHEHTAMTDVVRRMLGR